MFSKIILLIVMAFSFLSYGQGAPYTLSSGATFNVAVEKKISLGVLDTLSGASDSITVLNKNVFESGYEYILSIGVTTGTGTDSVQGVLRWDYFGSRGDTTLIRSTVFDTINTAVGEEIILPIYRPAYGIKNTLKILAGASNSRKLVIFNNFSLLKRKLNK